MEGALPGAAPGPRRDGRAMDALVLCARAEWRARWRSYLLLALVVAVTVAAALAMFSGATRAEHAFLRLRTSTNATDAVGYFEEVRDDPAAAVASVAAVEGVVAASAGAMVFVHPAGTTFIPSYDLLPVAPLLPRHEGALDAPVIVEGRAVDQGNAHEVALSEGLAGDLGLGVGDTLTLASVTDGWIEIDFNGGDAGPADGPEVTVDVVGLARTPADFGRWAGLIHLSTAFVDRYFDEIHIRTGVYAQLTDDAIREAQRTGSFPGASPDEIDRSPFGDDAATEDGLGTIAVALRLVAGTAVLAGMAVTGLMLARLAQLTLRERTALAAIGLTRGQQVLAAALTLTPWVLGGVAVGLAIGAATSPQGLVGLARAVDPAPTAILVDLPVLLAVGILALGTVLALVLLAARRAAFPALARARARPRPLAVQRPVPVVLGVGNALFGETERGGRTSRAALFVLFVGAAAAVAALTVSVSIARLGNDPALSGQFQSRVIDSGETLTVYDRALPRLEQDDRVASLTGIHVLFGIEGPDTPVEVLAYDVRRGDLGGSVVRGRMPRQPDEGALGPATLEDLDMKVGDSLELTGSSGSATFRIVGSVLFPEGDFSHDAGVALTADGAGRLVGDARTAGEIHQVTFEWGPGVDAEAGDQDLAADDLRVMPSSSALSPAVVTNLAEVEDLPRYLAVFLILLSLVSLAHALAVTRRLRRRELGTLRALGLTRRGAATVVDVQALTILIVALAAAVPVGLALGTQVWTAIADRAHVVVLSVWPWAGITVLVVAGAVSTMVLSAPPARRALRRPPAHALRAE